MLLKLRRHISLFFLTVFIGSIVWAHPNDDLDGDGVTAEGVATCGLYRLTVTQLDSGQYEMEAIFYHWGNVQDTRVDFPGRPQKWANFKFGVAFYKQAVNPIGQHNRNTDVDQNSIQAQRKNRWGTFEIRVGPQEEESHFRVMTLTYVVDDPSEWWVAGITYTSYAATSGASGDQMKAVSEYRIPSGTSSGRGYYYKETVWNKAHTRAGSATSWPWP